MQRACKESVWNRTCQKSVTRVVASAGLGKLLGASMNVSNRTDINALLAQMRELKAQAQTPLTPAAGLERGSEALRETGETPAFTTLFKQAIDSVNQTQQTATQLAQSYEQGDPQVALSQVMVAAQKASVSFQAVSQVRNRLVEAYQDVMNMPI